MVGQPEIKSKTNRLVFVPLDEDEKQMAIITKKLIIQDETTIHDFLVEAIILNLRKHNIFIGGNPNRQLFSFDGNAKPILPKCKCGKDSVKHGLHLPSKREFDFCSKCFVDLLGRHDRKVWSWTK